MVYFLKYKPQETLTVRVSILFSFNAVCGGNAAQKTQFLAQRISFQILCLLVYVCSVFQYINSYLYISHIFLSVTEIIRQNGMYIRGWIQNFPDWCRHLHSSCVSAKHRYMVDGRCLASLLAKFHVGGMA